MHVQGLGGLDRVAAAAQVGVDGLFKGLLMVFVVRGDPQGMGPRQLAGRRQRRDDLAQLQPRAEGVVVGHDVIGVGGYAPLDDVADQLGQDQFRVDPGLCKPVDRGRDTQCGQDRA